MLTLTYIIIAFLLAIILGTRRISFADWQFTAIFALVAVAGIAGRVWG